MLVKFASFAATLQELHPQPWHRLSRAVLEQEQYSQGLSRAAGHVSTSNWITDEKTFGAICASKKKTPAFLGRGFSIEVDTYAGDAIDGYFTNNAQVKKSGTT